MTRPRLLVVAPSAELYGSDRALLSTLPELSEAFAVTLAVPAPGPAVDRARAMGVEVVELPDYAIRRRHLRPLALLPWLARVVAAVARLNRLHREQPFQLVYSNTLAAGIGPLLRAGWRVPHLVHVHECPPGSRWFIGLLLAIARSSSDRVVCNSAFTRAFVVDRQPALAGRTTVVHNGIDLPDPSAGRGPVPPNSSPTDRLRVTCVARIHPKKGHLVLVEAVRQLVAGGRPVELHCYGDALPEHQALRRQIEARVAEAGLSASVAWHGFIDDTAAMYRDRDVAVVPSVVPEEFSLVCVEAQSMCLPVVATGPGGASEVVADGLTGVIVPPGDADALAAALASLADDPERGREMGRRGRARMEAHFAREPYAARLRDLCLEMAGPRAAAPETGRP